MTALMLQKAVSEFLFEKVSSVTKIKYTNQSGEEKEVNPAIIKGWITPKRQNRNNSSDLSSKEYAHIGTRISKAELSDKSNIVTLKIIVGVQSYDEYNEDECLGYIEICNLIEKIIQELLKQSTIAKKYQIQNNVTYKIPEEQPYPYWIGEISTNWELPPIYEEGIDI